MKEPVPSLEMRRRCAAFMPLSSITSTSTMRIAYVAPYQGPALMERRPTVQNLALAGNLKIELIAELLRRHRHDVEVLSQGEVVERRFRYYPAFSETKPSGPGIPVHYASALPVRFVNGWWSSRDLLALFESAIASRPLIWSSSIT